MVGGIIEREGKTNIMKESDKWQLIEEKLCELRGLVDENWNKGEWQLAVLGESTIRTVEQSKDSAEEMRQQANHYLKTIKTIQPDC